MTVQPRALAERGEDEALRQHLADQPPAPGTNGDADRDLALPCRAASEQEVATFAQAREVPDRQHRRARAGCGADRGEVVPQRCQLRCPAHILARVGALKRRGDRGEIGSRFWQRHARLEAPERPGVLPVGPRLRCPARRAERYPRLTAFRKVEARGHDANHRVRAAVHRDHAPNDRSLAAETTLPEAVPEQDDVVLAVLILLGKKVPSQQWANAEDRQEIRRNGRALDPFGFTAVAGERVRAPGPERQRGKAAIRVAPRYVVGIRHVRPANVARQVLRVDGDSSSPRSYGSGE